METNINTVSGVIEDIRFRMSLLKSSPSRETEYFRGKLDSYERCLAMLEKIQKVQREDFDAEAYNV